MRMERFALGSVEITAFSAGTFMVDGGAMFGVVPRVEWEKTCPPDEKNRVPISLNVFLIRTPQALVLADSGIGPVLNRKYLDFYGYRGTPDIGSLLGMIGFRPEDVDIVFNSHLHFDHCGGNVKRDDGGQIVPVFPRARYVVQRGEWRNALHPVERDRPSYFPANLRPIEDAGCLDLIEGNASISKGVEAVLIPGHTAFHQGLKVTDGGGIFFFLGDLLPTAAHVGLSSVMSFDLYPVETQENKKVIYRESLAGNWTLGFSHDPSRFFGRLRKVGRRFVIMPLE